jgi:hypothetical protein
VNTRPDNERAAAPRRTQRRSGYRAPTVAALVVTALVVTALVGCDRIQPPGALARESRALGQAGWEQLHFGGVSGRDTPSSGEDVAMAWDQTRHRLLLYGGKGDDNINQDELWSFDASTRRWSEIETTSPRPDPREDHTFVLDEENDVYVLFGGEDGPTSNETWLFDPVDASWAQVTDATTPALESHVSIYDPRAKRMLVYGGMRATIDEDGDSHKSIEGDTWAMDLDRSSPGYLTWQLVETPGPDPGSRREHRAVYDPLRHRMIVFGGRKQSRSIFLNDVWTLDLATDTWREVEVTGVRPHPVRQTALGYSARDDVLTMFGGEVHVVISHGRNAGDDEEFTINQVWAFDVAAGTWSDRTPYPRPMYDHAGVFVPDLDGMVVYGGSLRDGGKDHSTWLLRVQTAADHPNNAQAGIATGEGGSNP